MKIYTVNLKKYIRFIIRINSILFLKYIRFKKYIRFIFEIV